VRVLCGQLDLGERMMFTDHRVDISQVMAALDRLTVPSCRKALDRLTMEAVAMARPVVVAAGERDLDLVVSGETGLFVPLRNTDPLGRAMLQLFRGQGNQRVHGPCRPSSRRELWARPSFLAIENSVESRKAIMKELVFNNAGSSEWHRLAARGDA